jgi:Domain of unknown function (DUF6924)
VPRIGHTTQAVVVRTDFSDEECWRAVREEMLAETEEGFRAYVDIVEDPGFDGLGADEVLAAAGVDYTFGFLIVADHLTMAGPGHPLLVLDLADERGTSFRALPGMIQSVENNLSLANLDFADFAAAAKRDGVYRGFD